MNLKYFLCTIVAFIIASCAYNDNTPINSLSDTAWVSNYFEIPEDGISEQFDEVIVFLSNGHYIVYSVENNFNPIGGSYKILENSIVNNHKK